MNKDQLEMLLQMSIKLSAIERILVKNKIMTSETFIEEIRSVSDDIIRMSKEASENTNGAI